MASKLIMKVKPELERGHVLSGWTFFDRCRSMGFAVDPADRNVLTIDADGFRCEVRFDAKLTMDMVYISPDDEAVFRELIGEG